MILWSWGIMPFWSDTNFLPRKLLFKRVISQAMFFHYRVQNKIFTSLLPFLTSQLIFRTVETHAVITSLKILTICSCLCFTCQEYFLSRNYLPQLFMCSVWVCAPDSPISKIPRSRNFYEPYRHNKHSTIQWWYAVRPRWLMLVDSFELSIFAYYRPGMSR